MDREKIRCRLADRPRFFVERGPRLDRWRTARRRRSRHRGIVSDSSGVPQCRRFDRVAHRNRRGRGRFARRCADCYRCAGGPCGDILHGGSVRRQCRPAASRVSSLHGIAPKGFGLEVRHYHLRAETSFEIDVDELKRLCDERTALVLLNSPHNPTGSITPEAVRRDIHDFCAGRGIQFVCDQVFHPIYHGASIRTAAALPHATVLSDFSKALCLSGLRVGWIVDRNRDRLEKYREARTYFTVSNSPVTEWLALLAIRHREQIYTRAREVSAANLALIESAWSSLADRIAWITPQGGFTLFPSLHGERDTRPLCERLGARGILVVPGDCFGMPSYVRIGFGAPRAEFASGFERLNAEIETYLSERREPSAAAVP